MITRLLDVKCVAKNTGDGQIEVTSANKRHNVLVCVGRGHGKSACVCACPGVATEIKLVDEKAHIASVACVERNCDANVSMFQ